VSKRGKTRRRRLTKTLAREVAARLRASGEAVLSADAPEATEAAPSTPEVADRLRITTAPVAAMKPAGARQALVKAVREWSAEADNPVDGCDDNEVLRTFWASLREQAPDSDAFFVQEGDLGVTISRCTCGGSGVEVTR